MSFDPGGGGIANANDVALNNPINGQVLTYVASVGKWKNISGGLSVKHFGAKGDGVTDDAVAIQLAIDSMVEGGSLYFPEGTYMVGTTIQLPIVDGASLIGPISSQLRLPAAVIRAMDGADLPAIAATQEWLTNGEYGGGVLGGKDAQGIVIQGLGFDGGGFDDGQGHNDQIETTSNTEHGLIIHGSGWKLDHIFVLSANGHGIYVPGLGVDDGILKESHENTIIGCAVRYTGGDSLHAGPGAQDAWVEMFRPQFAGGHCIFIDDSCAAWSFVHCHPSWAAKDLIHLKSGWQCRVIGNYVGGLGVYMDGTGYPDPHYGIYVEGGPAIITGNSINGFPPIQQVDPMVAIYLKNGPVICKDNTFIYNPGEDGTLLEQHNITSPSVVTDNFAVTSS